MRWIADMLIMAFALALAAVLAEGRLNGRMDVSILIRDPFATVMVAAGALSGIVFAPLWPGPVRRQIAAALLSPMVITGLGIALPALWAFALSLLGGAEMPVATAAAADHARWMLERMKAVLLGAPVALLAPLGGLIACFSEATGRGRWR